MPDVNTIRSDAIVSPTAIRCRLDVVPTLSKYLSFSSPKSYVRMFSLEMQPIFIIVSQPQIDLFAFCPPAMIFVKVFFFFVRKYIFTFTYLLILSFRATALLLNVH